MHEDSVWEAVQRELRSILIDEVGGSWKEHESWKKLRAIRRSNNRVDVSDRKTSSSIADTQREALEAWNRCLERVEEVVRMAEEALLAERTAEIQSITGTAQQLMENALASAAQEEVAGRTLGPLQLVTSSTGFGGAHEVLLRPAHGTRLPSTLLAPGDAILLCSCKACILPATPELGASNQATGSQVVSASKEDSDQEGLALSREIIRTSAPSTSDEGMVPSSGELRRITSESILLSVARRADDDVFLNLYGEPLMVMGVPDQVTYVRQQEALKALELVCRNTIRSIRRGEPVPAASGLVASAFGDAKCVESVSPLASSFHAMQTKRSTQAASIKASKAKLDTAQQIALDFALDLSEPLCVIKGPPGTGKTQVIAQIVANAVSSGQKVLACAPSNMAVDNMVEKFIQEGLQVIRIGNPQRISEAALDVSLGNVVRKKLEPFRESMRLQRRSLRADLQAADNADEARVAKASLRKLARLNRQRERATTLEVLRTSNVILSTNIGAGDPVFELLKGDDAFFDLALVDEAAQATEPSTWIPLLRARRAVLVGDSCQLPPTVLSKEAIDLGLGLSLLERAERLQGGRLVRQLSTQYRMNESICSWSSEAMYSGSVQSAESVATRLLTDLPGVSHSMITSTTLMIVDTRSPTGALLPGAAERTSSSLGSAAASLYNEAEADLVKIHVMQLLRAGVPGCRIAVQSPYNAQVEFIRETLGGVAGAEAVEIASVDAFQGRESDAVIVSMVRCNREGSVGFLADARRLNVAVTRAKRHVAIICDSQTVARDPFLRKLLQYVKARGRHIHGWDVLGIASSVDKPTSMTIP